MDISFGKVGKNMTVDITWAKDKRDITTHNTQTKTFNSEEQAIGLQFPQHQKVPKNLQRW